MARSHPSKNLRPLLDFLNEENARADAEAAPFLEQAVEQWPRSAPLGYEALIRILDAAHENLDIDRRFALALSRLAIDRVRNVYVPAGWKACHRFLVGRAWKEHANALHQTGQLEQALAAIRQSQKVLIDDASEHLATRLLEAQLVGEMGQQDAARVLLTECAQEFERLGEHRRAMQTLIMKGAYLFRGHDYTNAQQAFLEASAKAEELHDDREIARILNNLGHCAVKLHDFHAAERYLEEAQLAFETQGMRAEQHNVMWGRAELQMQRGFRHKAVDDFQLVALSCLEQGSITEAARAKLRIVEILHDAGERERATRLARELVGIFAKVGAQPELQRALKYLADSSAEDRFALALRSVRDFVVRLTYEPQAQFLAA